MPGQEHAADAATAPGRRRRPWRSGTPSVSMKRSVSGPVREHQQPADVAAGDVRLQREHAGHVLTAAHARARRTSAPAPPSSPARIASSSRPASLRQAGGHHLAVHDQRHLAARQTGELAGDVVGEADTRRSRCRRRSSPSRAGTDTATNRRSPVLDQGAGRLSARAPRACASRTTFTPAPDPSAQPALPSHVPSAAETMAKSACIRRRCDSAGGVHRAAWSPRGSAKWARKTGSCVTSGGDVDGRCDAVVEQRVEGLAGHLEVGGDAVRDCAETRRTVTSSTAPSATATSSPSADATRASRRWCHGSSTGVNRDAVIAGRRLDLAPGGASQSAKRRAVVGRSWPFSS